MHLNVIATRDDYTLTGKIGYWFVSSGSSLTIDAASPKVPIDGEAYVDSMSVAVFTPTITITGGGSMSEASGAPITYTVTQDNSLGGYSSNNEAVPASPVTLNFSGSADYGNDYTSSVGNGETYASLPTPLTVTLTPKKDNLIEQTETVTLSAVSESAPTAAASATISDDPPVVTLTKVQDGSEDPDPSSTSSAPKPVIFEVNRTGGDLSTPINVNYSVAGTGDHPAGSSDYTGAGSSVSVTDSATISLGVTDDNEVEYHESLLLTLANDATHYTFNYNNGVPATTQSADIADNDFILKAMSASFDSQGIKHDSGTQDVYGSDQWDDSNGDGQSDIHGANTQDQDKGYPLSYQRSDPATARYITASTGVVIEYKDPNVLSGSLSIFGFGSGPGGGYFGGATSVGPPTLQPDGSQRATISVAATSQTALPSTIDAGVLSINWTLGRTVQTAGAASVITKSPGTSKNRIYVTGAAAPNAFETVLDVGCNGAAGKRPGNPGETADAASTANADVVTSIFDNKFTSLNLHDVEGNLLTYWGSQYGLGVNWPAQRDGTSSLLKYHDGRCGEWAGAFLPDILAVQGINSNYVASKGITVNFTSTVPANPHLTGTNQYFAGFYTPAEAQGNSVPTEKWFENHAIDEFFSADGKSVILLDPSYGIRVSGTGDNISQSMRAAELNWGTNAITAGAKGDWVADGPIATIIFPDGHSEQLPSGDVQGSDLFNMQNYDFVFTF